MVEHRAELTIAKKAKIDYKRVIGEIRSQGRSDTKINETKDQLKIVIEAKDATALRASINAVMRDLQVIEGASTI